MNRTCNRRCRRAGPPPVEEGAGESPQVGAIAFLVPLGQAIAAKPRTPGDVEVPAVALAGKRAPRSSLRCTGLTAEVGTVAHLAGSVDAVVAAILVRAGGVIDLTAGAASGGAP